VVAPTGWRPRARPKTKKSDYISYLSWSRLPVESAELSEIIVNRDVFRDHPGRCPREPPTTKVGTKINE